MRYIQIPFSKFDKFVVFYNKSDYKVVRVFPNWTKTKIKFWFLEIWFRFYICQNRNILVRFQFLYNQSSPMFHRNPNFKKNTGSPHIFSVFHKRLTRKNTDPTKNPKFFCSKKKSWASFKKPKNMIFLVKCKYKSNL